MSNVSKLDRHKYIFKKILRKDIINGPTAGFGVKAPLGAASENADGDMYQPTLAFDYSYRLDFMQGTHSLGMTVNF